MHRHAETRVRIVAVGEHVGPRQDQRAAVPGLTDQFVLPLVQHTGGIDVGAVHAEGFGIDDQLRPAAQAGFAELKQGQAARRGEPAAVAFVEDEFADGRDGFFVQEARRELCQARLTFRG
jgi:hypothetical protein